MPLSVLDVFRELNSLDFRVLSVIEVLMAKYEVVPIDEIVNYLKYTKKKIEKVISTLRKNKLIFGLQQHYLGFALSFIGYDALALKALVERGIIAQIGPEIGAGKESNIHLVINDDNHEFLVKFHRLGKLDFRATRKSRGFIAEKRHLSPLYESRLSAEREYKALNDLYNAGVSVPKPITQNRHLVAMEIVIGQDLYRIKKNEFQNEDEIYDLFENILHETKNAVKQGYIHGDLSEYNIRLNEDNYPIIFDWPQYVDVDSEHAEKFLMRDLQNVLNYFEKKFQMVGKINLSNFIQEYF
jgi:RIO kinase 2